jgi:hypothetical protein
MPVVKDFPMNIREDVPNKNGITYSRGTLAFLKKEIETNSPKLFFGNVMRGMEEYQLTKIIGLVCNPIIVNGVLYVDINVLDTSEGQIFIILKDNVEIMTCLTISNIDENKVASIPIKLNYLYCYPKSMPKYNLEIKLPKDEPCNCCLGYFIFDQEENPDRIAFMFNSTKEFFTDINKECFYKFKFCPDCGKENQ